MRLAEGIVVDNEKTFGTLKFSGLRREVFARDENGERTGEVKERTYDLRSSAQGMMIQVSIPADVSMKEFEYKSEVELVEPVLDTVANANYRGAEVGWYLKAKDIVAKKPSGQQEKPQQKERKENVMDEGKNSK